MVIYAFLHLARSGFHVQNFPRVASRMISSIGECAIVSTERYLKPRLYGNNTIFRRKTSNIIPYFRLRYLDGDSSPADIYAYRTLPVEG